MSETLAALLGEVRAEERRLVVAFLRRRGRSVHLAALACAALLSAADLVAGGAHDEEEA